jgi:hypothetical protein
MELTGKELAHAHLLDLSDEERSVYYKENKTSWFRELLERLQKRKLFLITFGNGAGQRAAIICAKDKYSACVNIFPFIADDDIARHRHPERPLFRSDCSECQRIFNQYADWLNGAKVTCIGTANAYSKKYAFHL